MRWQRNNAFSWSREGKDQKLAQIQWLEVIICWNYPERLGECVENVTEWHGGNIIRRGHYRRSKCFVWRVRPVDLVGWGFLKFLVFFLVNVLFLNAVFSICLLVFIVVECLVQLSSFHEVQVLRSALPAWWDGGWWGGLLVSEPQTVGEEVGWTGPFLLYTLGARFISEGYVILCLCFTRRTWHSTTCGKTWRIWFFCLRPGNPNKQSIASA